MNAEDYEGLVTITNGEGKDFDDDVRHHVAQIAADLDCVAEGCEYVDDDGDTHMIDLDEEPDDEDWEQVSMGDWLSDGVYDIKYVVNDDGSYCAARLMVAGGGPNIYVNTFTQQVELFWGATRATCPIRQSAIDQLDEYLEVQWNDSFTVRF